MSKKMLLFLLFVCFIYTILIIGCPPDPGPPDEPTPTPTAEPVITPTPPIVLQKLVRTYNAGPDTIWFTGDDQIISIESREDFDGFEHGKSKEFGNPGPDSNWSTLADNIPIGYFWSRLENGGHWCWGSGPNGIWFDWDDNFSEYELWEVGYNGIYGNPGGDNLWFTGDDILTAYNRVEVDTNGVRIRQVYYNDPGTDLLWFTSDDVIGLAYYGAYADFSGNTEPDFFDNWTLGIFYDSLGGDSTWFTSDDVIDHVCVREYDGIYDYATSYNNWAQEIRYNGPGPDSIWLTGDDIIENYRVTENIEGTSVPAPTPVPPDPPMVLAEDSYEDDDDYTSANEILYETDAIGTYDQFHSIYPGGDPDWLYFSANNGDTYVIELYPVPGGVNFDSYLELYDIDGTTQLATNDDGGTGLYSKITWTCPATGTYYIMARDLGAWDAGHYIIYVVHLVSGIINIVIE